MNDPEISLYRGDANGLLMDIADGSIDLIATDPPYEIGFDGNEWDRPDRLNWNRLAVQFHRVLKPDGVTCGRMNGGIHRF